MHLEASFPPFLRHVLPLLRLGMWILKLLTQVSLFQQYAMPTLTPTTRLTPTLYNTVQNGQCIKKL